MEKALDFIPVITGVVTIASAVVAITKTPGRFSKLKGIYKLIELLALNIGRAKDKGE